MKKIYNIFCQIEVIFASVLLMGLTTLMFVSAVSRTMGNPINWAQDVCLVAFAWMIFLGSDIAVRGPGLIGIDLISRKLPKIIQKILNIVFKLIIIGFLAVLVYYGQQMAVDGWARQITTLKISYSWVTLAVPVGSFFMIISTVIRLVEVIKTPLATFGEKPVEVEEGGTVV